jgi:hypothetical protein
MRPRSDRLPEPSPSGTITVGPALLVVGVLLTPFLRSNASRDLTPGRLSALEPQVTEQKIVVSHLNRRVQLCVPVPTTRPTACAPLWSDVDGATVVFFEPIATANGIASHARRVAVTLPEGKGLQKKVVELAVGEWAIEWPGCRDVRRLNVHAASGQTPRVALRTTSGGCELVSNQCRLTAGVAEQRINIEE